MKTITICKLHFIYLLVIIGSNLSISQTKTDFRSMPGLIQLKEMKYSVDHNSRKSLLDEVVYKYDMNGNLIELNLNSAEIINRITFLYNISNKLIEENCYNVTTLRHKYKYNYDAAGKLVEEICLDRNNNTLFVNSIKYNASGKVIEKTSDIPVKLQMNNFYDSQNRMIKTEITSTSATMKQIEFMYNPDGTLFRETIFTSLKKSTTGKKYQASKLDYEYDQYRRLTGKKNYLTDEIIEKFMYHYNDDGDLIKWEKFNPQGNLVYLVEYEYIKR